MSIQRNHGADEARGAERQPFSLNPVSDFRQEYVYNPLYAANPEPRNLRPRGRSHTDGTCGYMGSLCGTCHDLQYKWHIRIAERIGREYPAMVGEDGGDYWRRVGGSFCDTWCDAVRVALAVSLPNPMQVAESAVVAESQEVL